MCFPTGSLEGGSRSPFSMFFRSLATSWGHLGPKMAPRPLQSKFWYHFGRFVSHCGTILKQFGSPGAYMNMHAIRHGGGAWPAGQLDIDICIYIHVHICIVLQLMLASQPSRPSSASEASQLSQPSRPSRASPASRTSPAGPASSASQASQASQPSKPTWPGQPSQPSQASQPDQPAQPAQPLGPRAAVHNGTHSCWSTLFFQNRHIDICPQAATPPVMNRFCSHLQQNVTVAMICACIYNTF